MATYSQIMEDSDFPNREEIIKLVKAFNDIIDTKSFADRIKFSNDLMEKKDIYDFNDKTNIW